MEQERHTKRQSRRSRSQSRAVESQAKRPRSSETRVAAPSVECLARLRYILDAACAGCGRCEVQRAELAKALKRVQVHATEDTARHALMHLEKGGEISFRGQSKLAIDIRALKLVGRQLFGGEMVMVRGPNKLWSRAAILKVHRADPYEFSPTRFPSLNAREETDSNWYVGSKVTLAFEDTTGDVRDWDGQVVGVDAESGHLSIKFDEDGEVEHGVDPDDEDLQPRCTPHLQGSAKSMADGDDDCRDTANDTHTAKAKRNAKAKAKQTPVVDFAEAEEATEQDLEEQIAYQQSKSTRSGGKGSPMMPTGAFVRPDGVNEQGAGGAQPSRRRKQQHRKKEKKKNNKRNKYLQPKKKKKSATASGQEQEQEVAMGSVAKQAQQRRLEQERAEQRR